MSNLLPHLLKKLKAHPVLSSELRVIAIPALDTQPIVVIKSELLPICSEYARSIGSPIGKIVDRRIGPMNEYFVGVLDQVAAQFFEAA